MADSIIETAELVIVGTAECVGGVTPEPHLDGYPLLVHSPGSHGGHVMTEDGRASVHDVAVAFAASPDAVAVASKFGTTVDHVAQAVDYAVAAGLLAAGKS